MACAGFLLVAALFAQDVPSGAIPKSEAEIRAKAEAEAKAKTLAEVERKVRALLEQGRAALDSWERWGEARACFEQVLTLTPYTWNHPFASLGLATLARAEGFPDRSLDILARLEARVARWQASDSVVGIRAEIQEERCRCYLALGLLDRAGVALLAFQSLVPETAAVDRRFTVYAAQVDLRLAARDARRAIRDIQAAETALGAAMSKGPVPFESTSMAAALRLRRQRAKLRMDPGSGELEELASALDAASAAAPFGDPERTHAGIDAVDAWVASGRYDLAWACSKRLMEPPFESLERETEICAQHARLTKLRGCPAEETREARNKLEQLTQRLFAAWRSAPIRTGGSGAFVFEVRREILGALVDLDQAVLAGDELATVALDHIESVLSLGTLSRRFAGAQANLAMVRETLIPPGGGVLMVAYSPHGVQRLLMDAQGTELLSTDVAPSFYESLAEYERAIESRPDDTSPAAFALVRQLGEKVAAQLMPAEVRDRIVRWKSMLLVGDENHVAAWQAMPLRESWLGAEIAMAHVPSCSLALSLHNRRAARAPLAERALDLAIVGDPVLLPEAETNWGVQELRLTQQQKRALGGGFPEDRVHAYWGEEATIARLAEGPVKSAHAWCVLTHGVEDFGRERSAGIVLSASKADDLVLFADAVEQLRAPPLVVLGVCGAASGPRRIGEDGVQHLGGAFLWAGADCVVLAKGQVSLGSTIDLLETCFARLRAGDGIAEALRAGRALVAADRQRAHPFYFAGLRAFGLGGFAVK